MGNEIGLRIAQLRGEKGLSQKQLADELEKIGLKVRRETVTQWENGSRDLKTEYTVKLADFFGVTCDYILRGIESENVNISKETGLTNDSIISLKTLSCLRKGYGSLTVANAINSFMGSEGFVQFMVAFWDYQIEVEKLATCECEFIEALRSYEGQLPDGMTALEYAAELALEEASSLRIRARSILKQADCVNYKLFKLEQGLKKITDNYRKGREKNG